MKMLTICGNGHKTRYKWTKIKKGATSKYPALTNVVRKMFDYSTAKAIDALPLLTDDQLLGFCDHLGLQKDELKNIKKEIRQRNK